VRGEELALGDHLLDLGRGPCFAGGIGEVGPVVGEDGMDLVGDRLDQTAQEVRGCSPRHLLVQLDKSELRGPVDRDDEVEPALRGSNPGDVDMEIADRIGLELAPGRGFAFNLRQARDPVAPKATMQRRARQMRDRRLQSVQAIVERQQGMPSEGDHNRLLFNGQDG
jgi:hypothetical protein